MVWGRSTAGSRSSVSSVPPVPTRTQQVNCLVSRVPALKDRALLVPKTCHSVEVIHHHIIRGISKAPILFLNSTEIIAVLSILIHRSWCEWRIYSPLEYLTPFAWLPITCRLSLNLICYNSCRCVCMSSLHWRHINPMCQSQVQISGLVVIKVNWMVVWELTAKREQQTSVVFG